MRVRTCLIALSAVVLAGCLGSDREEPKQALRSYGDTLFPQLAEVASYHPADSCASEEAIRADLLTQLRAGMMVTGLTCRGHFGEDKVFDRYMDFMVDHQSAIRDSQRTLGRFIGSYQRGNQNRLFDTYITRLANDESQLVNDLSAAQYCAARQAQFFAVSDFESDDELEDYLDQWASRRAGVYNTDC
jgi:hypothetical protein